MASEGSPGETDTPRRIRVAQVITSVVLGGGGQVISAIARNIDQSRFEMDVYCVLEGGELVDYVRSFGFRVHFLPICHTRGFVRYHIGPWLQLVRMLQRGRYDIVHTHLFRADLVGTVAAMAAGRRVVVKTLHNMGTRRRTYHRVVDRLLAPFIRRVVCVSEAQRLVTVRRDGVDDRKVVVIRNGVQMERFERSRGAREAAAGLGLDPARPIVGTVGRLIEEKGHAYLIQAMPEIIRRHPGTQFLIVGGGPLQPTIEREARDSAGTGVVITGLRPDVPELLGLMDVFVFPSLSEGSPIAALEAMAAGIPVACTDIPALQEIMRPQDTCLMFRAGNAASLADAVCRMLGDSELRRTLAEQARKMVRTEYSEQGMIRAYEAMYRDLLGE